MHSNDFAVSIHDHDGDVSDIARASGDALPLDPTPWLRRSVHPDDSVAAEFAPRLGYSQDASSYSGVMSDAVWEEAVATADVEGVDVRRAAEVRGAAPEALLRATLTWLRVDLGYDAIAVTAITGRGDDFRQGDTEDGFSGGFDCTIAWIDGREGEHTEQLSGSVLQRYWRFVISGYGVKA